MNRDKRNYLRMTALFMMILLFLPIQTSAATTATSSATTQTYFSGNFNKNQTITISDANSYKTSGKLTWIKYKASKTGYVRIAFSENNSSNLENTEAAAVQATGRIRLYDKAKASRLSSSIYYNASSSNSSYKNVYFGVKKNTTYYFQVRANAAVKMKLTFKANNDKSGNKLSKAVKLNKNKNKSGIIYPNQDTSDWYKIVLSKKQVLNLYYSSKTSGNLSVRLYYGYKYMGTGNMTRTQTGEQHMYTKSDYGITKKAKVPAGTYYVRVSASDSMSSGYYRLRWK